MKTINLSNFLQILLEDVKAKRSVCYTISEDEGKNIFTVKEKLGDKIYLEISEDNKYDVLFNKITETFSGQYELASVHTLVGEYEIDIVIDNIIIVFNYYTKTGKNWVSQDGRKWVYNMYSEI